MVGCLQTGYRANAGDIDSICRDGSIRFDGVEVVQQPSNDADKNGRWRYSLEV
jgi:hypothetical protein